MTIFFKFNLKKITKKKKNNFFFIFNFEINEKQIKNSKNDFDLNQSIP